MSLDWFESVIQSIQSFICLISFRLGKLFGILNYYHTYWNLGDKILTSKTIYIWPADTILKAVSLLMVLHKMIPVAIGNSNEYSWRIKKVPLNFYMALFNYLLYFIYHCSWNCWCVGDSAYKVKICGDEALEKVGEMIVSVRSSACSSLFLSTTDLYLSIVSYSSSI